MAAKGELLDVILGYECNYACDYCTLTPELRQKNFTSEQVRAHIQEAARRGLRRIAFGGGEPTLRSDLIPLIEVARDCGFTWVKVHTNGARLAYDAYLERLLRAGVDEFHVTVSGPDEATRDAITRVPGSDRTGLQAIAKLVEWAQDVVVTPILNEATFRSLPATLRRYAALGVRRFHIELVSLTDGNAANIASLPRIADVFPFLRECFDWGRAEFIEVFQLHVPRCMLPGYENHAFDPASAFDDVVCVTPEATFRLRDAKLTPGEKIPACRRCQWDAECLGARRDYLAKFGSSELTPDSRPS